MPFYVFAWIGSILYGISALVSKLATKHHIANPWLFTFAWSLFVLIFMIPFALIAGVGFPHRWDTLFLISIFNALCSILYILALYRLDISILAPLYSFRVPISVFLGILLFNEKLTLFQSILIGCTTFAGMFVSMDERFSFRSFFRKPIWIALGAIATSAIYGATVKNAMAHDGYWEVTLWSTILTQVVLLITVPKFWKELHHISFRKYQGLVLSALFVSIGTIAAYKAYAANVGITSAILALPLSMIFVFILSFVAPNLLEKHSLKVYAVRFAAAAVMIVSAIRLSM